MRRALFLVAAATTAGFIASVVWGAFTDTQQATGSVTASSTSADLYLCENFNGLCTIDDSGPDEAIFEAMEDLRPGDVVSWPLSLVNMGTDQFIVLGVSLTIVELADPGEDCPSNALRAGRKPGTTTYSNTGVWSATSVRDPIPGAPTFLYYADFRQTPLVAAAGWGVDVILTLELSPSGTAGCDGNVWDVNWEFTVG